MEYTFEYILRACLAVFMLCVIHAAYGQASTPVKVIPEPTELEITTEEVIIYPEPVADVLVIISSHEGEKRAVLLERVYESEPFNKAPVKPIENIAPGSCRVTIQTLNEGAKIVMITCE